MNRFLLAERGEGLKVHALNIFLSQLSLIINFFGSNQYPLFSKEALLFTAGLLMLLFLFFVPFYVLRLPFLFESFLLFVWLDLTIGAGDLIYRLLRPTPLPRNLSLALSYFLFVAIAFIVGFLLRKHLAKILSLVFLVTLGSTVFTTSFASTHLYEEKQQTGAELKQNHKGNILILILDEHLGLDGFPQEMEKARSLRSSLIKTYSDQGFSLYGQAFSNYQWTTSSLYNIFNVTKTIDFDPRLALKFDDNKLLRRLHNEGYSLHVSEGTWVDVCPNDLPCSKLVYRHDSLGYLYPLPLKTLQKVAILCDGFIFGYKSLALQTLQRFKLDPRTSNKKLAGTGTERIVGKLMEDLQKLQTGQVFLIHLSLPHNPYLFDRDCHLKNPSFWENRSLVGQREQLTGSWKRKYELYFDQVECVHAQVKRVLDELHQLGTFDQTTIVLFGDHGSRIALEERPDQMIERDYLDWYSAFLAIKPGSDRKLPDKFPSGYVSEKVSLRTRIGSYFGILEQPESADPTMVCVFTKNGCSFKKMPDFPIWK